MKKTPDPLFDGHLEKPLGKMTPREKLRYIWLQMLFQHKVRNSKKWGENPPPESQEKQPL